jgi:GTPase
MQKCAFIAVLGAPNAGKSTLVNQLVGSKVSIVTPKVQTTRQRILGIQIVDQSQLIFMDTPGVFTPRKDFDQAMVESALSTRHDADILMLVVDARSPHFTEIDLILPYLQHPSKPLYLVLNKIDLVEKPKLLELAQSLSEKAPFNHVFMVSALKGLGTDDLLKHLNQDAPKGPWHFNEDDITDVPLKMFAAEITREKVFLNLQEEIPYGVYIEPESWTEFDNGSVKIEQAIVVQKPNHKAIVIGKKGQTLKKIGLTARIDLEAQLDRKVHLILFVKVRENWMEDQSVYKMLGLEKPKKK